MASPLSLYDEGPKTLAQSSGWRVLPSGDPDWGSLPNWLIGLPMLTAGSYSPTACFVTVVVPAPTSDPKKFLTGSESVTLSWVGRLPATGLTVTPLLPSVNPLRPATVLAVVYPIWPGLSGM